MSEEQKVLYVRTDPELREEIDRYIVDNDLTYTEFVLRAIRAYLDATHR